MRGRVLAGSMVVGLLVGMVGSAPAATTPEFGYVTNQIFLPATSEEANQLARDIDHDGTKDNQLGNVLAALIGAAGSSSFDPTVWTREDIETGDIVMLHSLRTSSLNNSNNATWQVWYGAPTANPDFSGGGTFALLTAQPHSGKLDAKIVNHRVTTVTGKIPLRLDFGAGPFTMKTVKSRIVGSCFRSGCPDGVKLNGAITEQEMNAKFTPKFAEGMTALLVADCNIPAETVECAPDSAGEFVNDFFNMSPDLAISIVELQDNSLWLTLTRPDLDLFKANGDPGQDGVEDALSYGIGFTTVKATLTRP